MSAFEDARARFDRAQEHLATLYGETAAFLASDGYRFWTEQSLQGQTYRSSLHGESTRPLESHWPLLIGECLYNLRACLDYLAGGFDGRNFPIDATGSEYFAMNKTGDYVGGAAHTQGMRGPVKAAIEALQPYNVTPEAPRSDPLWLLEAMRNRDVHGRFHIFAGAVANPAWHVVPAEAITAVKITIPDRKSDNSTELVRLRGRLMPGFKPEDVKVTLRAKGHIVFAPDELGAGQDIPELLNKMVVRVGEIANTLRGL